MAERVLPAIALVKQDRAREAAPLVEAAIGELTAASAGIVVLACTELPVAADAADQRPEACLDATEALARACIQWHHHRLSTLPGP
jgi:aspartate racemase